MERKRGRPVGNNFPAAVRTRIDTTTLAAVEAAAAARGVSVCRVLREAVTAAYGPAATESERASA